MGIGANRMVVATFTALLGSAACEVKEDLYPRGSRTEGESCQDNGDCEGALGCVDDICIDRWGSGSGSGSSTDDDGSGGSSTAGQDGGAATSQAIYVRFVLDGCSGVDVIRSDNPQVGSNARLGVSYGPTEPGSYSGQFDWAGNNRGVDDVRTMDFSFRLAEPEPGFTRRYTITLMRYDKNLGRCLFSANDTPFADTKVEQ